MKHPLIGGIILCISLLSAKEPVRISLAESPVPGLRERVETHLSQEYDCVVISRSQPVAMALEQSIEQMRNILAAAPAPDGLLAAEVCARISAWDEYLSVQHLDPADNLREISFALTPLASSTNFLADFQREKVPARSDYERTLAARMAQALQLSPKLAASPCASKAVTLAVLPLTRHEKRSFVNTSIPSDTLYLGMESGLNACLPQGASILSRDRIQAVLAEHNIASLAPGDSAAMRAIAHLLPAQALVCGTVSRRLWKPVELRLDLQLIEPRSGVILAAAERRCEDGEDALSAAAEKAIRALMDMPWRPFTAQASPAFERMREAQFMLDNACPAAAWGLARDQADLRNQILNGLLYRVGSFANGMKPLPENPDSPRTKILRESAVMIDGLLGESVMLEAEKHTVPWPNLIRAEIRYWLGEYMEAEKLCRAHLSEHPESLTSRAELILAWSLFKQGRLDASKAMLKRAEQRESPMWYFPGLGRAYVGFWANNLHLALAKESGDGSDVYRRVKWKMQKEHFFMGDEMSAYLREVEAQEGTKGAIRDLSSLLVFNGGRQYDDALRALKPSNLSAQCNFMDLFPAYAVRGRCYERLGDKQKALDDYATVVLAAKHFGFHPLCVRLNEEQKSYHMPYVTASVDGVKRLQAEGLKPKNDWRSFAQTRPFPNGLAIYIVPVGTCDQAKFTQLITNTSTFFGARPTVLAPVALPPIRSQNKRSRTPYFDGKELNDAVMKQLAVPDNALLLVLATSEAFWIEGGYELGLPGSYDGGHTLLLSLQRNGFKGLSTRDALALALHYRYTANFNAGWRMDSPSVRYFCENTAYCISPCIFAGNLQILSGEADGICPRCQEAYRNVDFDTLNRQTVGALRRQGVRIVPATAASAREAAGELEREQRVGGGQDRIVLPPAVVGVGP